MMELQENAGLWHKLDYLYELGMLVVSWAQLRRVARIRCNQVDQGVFGDDCVDLSN